MNPARQASIRAGLPDSVPAWIVNQMCGSGLRAVVVGAQMIETGECDIVLAGGQESMSRARHAALIRFGKKMGDVALADTMMLDGLTDAFSHCAMGITAENIAARFHVTREEQDKWALRSQQRATKAVESGDFDAEIIPVTTKEGVIRRDTAPRPDTNADKLARLKPAFKKDGGTVTAGNASSIDDGAAAVALMTAQEARRRNLQPLGRIVSYAQAGVDPEIMGIGPVPASRLALKRAGWASDDLDLIEENEAFAAQTVYVIREMGWPEEKINVHGGAIALGHPIGATGARLLATILHTMKRQNKQKGLVTLCIGGGMGIAMCVERA
jgi:acetyl-CoA C-acetyltransferase